MRIFLDARDLISMLEGRGPCSLNDLRRSLQQSKHEVVLSPTVVLEVARPLVDPASKTVVTKLLNDLETLPLTYIADSQIAPRELRSAIESFTQGREYTPIHPFVARLDAAIPTSGPAPTALYLHHGLADTIFTLWAEAPDVFRWPTEQVNRLRSTLAADRSLSSPPSLAQHFREKLRRDLRLHRMSEPACSLDPLADWIYQSPTRCPGVRLAYEVFHHLRRNVGDVPTASDFGDFVHVQCLPYVDLITLDRRTADYVRRSTRGWPGGPAQKIRHDLASIIQEL